MSGSLKNVVTFGRNHQPLAGLEIIPRGVENADEFGGDPKSGRLAPTA